MPFSANHNFREKPRLIAAAKDMHYYDVNGRKMLDACAGLWCCNAGHSRDSIARAIADKAATLDFAPTFQYGHPDVFEFSQTLAEKYFPKALSAIFLSNSGSEAADSAFKIALAYQRLRGKGEKQLIIGREQGYHGTGFGGISAGGIVKNRLWYGSQIVEPVSGSAGVLPPPKGYLQRLRELCTKHDILLIFDEVITAFGRLGKTTAADYFGVVPDMLTFAKGCTSGTVPLGGVAVRGDIRQAFLDATSGIAIDLFHGYTYSGHPLAVAAGKATLALYEEEGLMQRGDDMVQYFEDAVHSLRDSPNVKDIRNIGFMAAVELHPREGNPGARGMALMEECFHHRDVVVRITGDTLAISPPLIMEKAHIDEIVGKVGDVLKTLA